MGKKKSLAHDLTEAVRSAVAGNAETTEADRMSVMEDEYQILVDRRRRVRESIALLEQPPALKPDLAARLAQYKIHEQTLSRRCDELQREIEWRRSPQQHLQ